VRPGPQCLSHQPRSTLAPACAHAHPFAAREQVGVLIKGETTHFEVISESVTTGIMNVGLQTGIPCVFGVLTAMNDEQAVSRSTGSNNHGVDWGKAAVEMAVLRKSALTKQSSKQFMGFGEDAEASPSTPPKTRIGF